MKREKLLIRSVESRGPAIEGVLVPVEGVHCQSRRAGARLD